jgi:hypothetical protein
LREHDCSVADGLCLRRDSGSFGPRVPRATGDHRNQGGGERDAERGRGPAARRGAVGGEPLEELVEPQVEVAVGLQSRTSLRRCGLFPIQFITFVQLGYGIGAGLSGMPGDVQPAPDSVGGGEVEVLNRRFTSRRHDHAVSALAHFQPLTW